MSATCPACGVAVVPGYVRCPKCQKPLPAARRASTVAGPGGTAVSGGGGVPMIPLAIGGAIVLVIGLVVALRGGDKKSATAETPPDELPQPSDPESPDPGPDLTPTTTVTPTPQGGPSAADAAADLDRELKRQRLWGTVQVVGARVDVRTSACQDPNMGGVLDAASEPLKSAGLTRLRCLEQSGTVVFERDL